MQSISAFRAPLARAFPGALNLATAMASCLSEAMLFPDLILLATVLERISAHLEVMRNHPLTTRRYYKRVAY